MTAPPDHPPSRAHDPDARLQDFVRSAWPRLIGTAWLLCGDRHDAEDLVQTALVKCWRRWDSSSTRCAFSWRRWRWAFWASIA